MSLMRRTRNEIDWPEWFTGRRGFDWPMTLKEFMEDSDLRVEEFEEDVEASYVEGILEVRLPIDTNEAEAHKTPVPRG